MISFKVKAISPLVSRVKVEGELAGFVTFNPADNTYTSLDANGDVIGKAYYYNFHVAVATVVANS